MKRKKGKRTGLEKKSKKVDINNGQVREKETWTRRHPSSRTMSGGRKKMKKNMRMRMITEQKNAREGASIQHSRYKQAQLNVEQTTVTIRICFESEHLAHPKSIWEAHCAQSFRNNTSPERSEDFLLLAVHHTTRLVVSSQTFLSLLDSDLLVLSLRPSLQQRYLLPRVPIDHTDSNHSRKEIGRGILDPHAFRGE